MVKKDKEYIINRINDLFKTHSLINEMEQESTIGFNNNSIPESLFVEIHNQTNKYTLDLIHQFFQLGFDKVTKTKTARYKLFNYYFIFYFLFLFIAFILLF